MFNNLIGKTIQEMRTKSFFINSEMICEIITLYIKVDSGLWFRIIVSEGISEIICEKKEPHLVKPNEINDKFAYPISKLERINDTIGIISGIKEYLYKGMQEESVGFFIDIQGKEGFSYIERNGCNEIFKGMYKDGNIELINFPLPRR